MSEEYVCPQPEEFQELLNGLFLENEENVMNPCQQKIQYMIDNELDDLFQCCSLTIQEPNASKEIIFNALIVLKRALAPTANIPFQLVQGKWFSDTFSNIRELIKDTIKRFCLPSEHFFIRNEAAHCLSYILMIEQDKGKDLILMLIDKLNSNDTNENFKSGIVSAFKEIFSTPLIFNDEVDINLLPKELIDFFHFLLFQLSCQGLDQEQYLECATCLELMIVRIPKFFIADIAKNITDILDILETAFPFAEDQLYRRFHFIMLALLDEYYAYADKFFNRILEFAAKGLTSSYNTISIDFLSYIYKVEKSKGNGFQFTRKASEQLTETIIQINLELKDPEETDYIDPDVTDWNYYCSKLLNRFSKASINDDPNQETDETINIIIDFLQYCINDAEKDMPSILAFISVLSSICIRTNILELNDVLASYFSYVIDCCHHPLSRVSVNSLTLLNKFVKKDNQLFSSRELAQSIFKTVTDMIPSENISIVERLIAIMINCCKYFPSDAKIYFYSDIMDIVNEMMSNEFILNSPLNGKAYSILTNFFDPFTKDCKQENEDRTDLIGKAKALLDESLNFLAKSFNFVIQSLQTLQIEIFAFIRTLIIFLEEKANDYIAKAVNIVLKIVKKYEFIEESFQILVSITYKNSSQIFSSIDQILEAIDYGFNSGSPSIIGNSALLIGSLFNKLKTHAIPYVGSNLDRLFDLLTNPDVDNRRDYYGNLILAIALTIKGVRTEFPPDERDCYIEKLIELSQAPFDKDSENEREELSHVFANVAYGFYIILKVYSAYENNDFLEKFSMKCRRVKKNAIIEFLIYVGKNKLYFVNASAILNYLKLIQLFAKITQRTYNAKLNSVYIRNIMKYGMLSDNVQIRERSGCLIESIRKL